ncbi:MAG: lytic transglycosylase F [Candidatus Sulfotelmatobacter sp.]
MRFVPGLCLLLSIVCGKTPCEAQPQTTHAPGASQGETSLPSADTGLSMIFEHRTGDLDAMIKRRSIRALVLYSRSGFFYIDGRPQGIYYEALQAFEQFVNQKLHTGRERVQVTFIPLDPSQIESALTAGVGDVIAYGVTVTPERQQQVAFSIPILTDVKQIVVTGKKIGLVSSWQDLSGKKVFVNPLTTYYGNLEKINDSLAKQGKPPILVQKADKNLLDEDLLEMVNAGIIPATVTITQRAKLWASVFPDITPQPSLVLADEGNLAFAMRKDNPQFKQLVDEFIKAHGVGTSFGNTVLRRYLDNTHWVKNPTSEAEVRKFNDTLAFFKKYSTQYGFDYLMIVAQGYQESMLNQSARNGRAVGIMQVEPATAAAPPISIPDVMLTANNIHAGVKILREIADKYLSDPQIDPENRLLLTFASYNAGPTRIAELRKRAPSQGLDPNQWFGNVELMVAQSVGQVTVQYVSNIYKYYVAYKQVVEQGETLQ